MNIYVKTLHFVLTHYLFEKKKLLLLHGNVILNRFIDIVAAVSDIISFEFTAKK